jgi:L-aminopeptidase/D-esterase-like protein
MSNHVDTWFRIGHVTHVAERTGCTVIVFEEQVPAVVDVRGGAPGTRETDLLDAGRLVGRVDAILLSGGSAFGLAAADGVMRYLAERGRGLPTSAGPVPIVPAAVIFDLPNGAPRSPSADDGFAAAVAASPLPAQTGRVGAGTGATVAKLGALGTSTPSGIGIAASAFEAGTVTAVVVVNSLGDVRDPQSGTQLARSVDPAGMNRSARELALANAGHARIGENTAIGVVLVSTPIDRSALVRCGIAAHDALARCVEPAHTLFDGDTFFVASPSEGESSPRQLLAIQCAVEIAVERAIVSLFRPTMD